MERFSKCVTFILKDCQSVLQCFAMPKLWQNTALFFFALSLVGSEVSEPWCSLFSGAWLGPGLIRNPFVRLLGEAPRRSPVLYAGHSLEKSLNSICTILRWTARWWSRQKAAMWKKYFENWGFLRREHNLPSSNPNPLTYFIFVSHHKLTLLGYAKKEEMLLKVRKNVTFPQNMQKSFLCWASLRSKEEHPSKETNWRKWEKGRISFREFKACRQISFNAH